MREIERRATYRSISKSPTPVLDDTLHGSDISKSEESNASCGGKNKSNTPERSITPSATETHRSFVFYGSGLVLVILLLIFGFNREKPREKTCSFKKLKQVNLHQDQYLWESLTSGIENILNEKTATPGVFLFLHNGSNSIKNLISDIAGTASSCFGNKGPVEMETMDFTSEDAIKDYGNAIEKYKMKIKEGHVILIANLNDIPAEAALALHDICDTYNPIVKNVIIFLTLFSTETGGTPKENAKNTLIGLWGSKLENSSLDPLITRLMYEVIALKSYK